MMNAQIIVKSMKRGKLIVVDGTVGLLIETQTKSVRRVTLQDSGNALGNNSKKTFKDMASIFDFGRILKSFHE